MFPNFTFISLKIFSKEKLQEKKVFEWEFSDINFLSYWNDSGKTTIFNIMKDLLWNPNVAGSGVKGNDILSKDLLEKNLKCELHFRISWNEYICKKNYLTNDHVFIKLDDSWAYTIGWIDRFIISLRLGIPPVESGGKKPLTLFSIMRLCYISSYHQSHRNKLVENIPMNAIINHNNDWFTKILFYAYVLGVFEETEDLERYYKIIGTYKEAKYNMRIIGSKMRTLVNRGIERESLFAGNKNTIRLIARIQDRIRELQLDNLNYKEVLSNLEEIQYINHRVKSSQTENKMVKREELLFLLEKDIELIHNKLRENKNEIAQMEKELTKNYKELNKLDEISLEHSRNVQEGISSKEWKMVYEKLTEDYNKEKGKALLLEKEYNRIIDLISKSNPVRDLNMIVLKSLELLQKEKLSAKLILEEGSFATTTTADSTNRIILFNILTSFIFLKNIREVNHPGFIFFDSPFIGLDKKKEEKTIHSLCFRWLKENRNGQLFISLNPEDLDLKSVLGDLDTSRVSIKEWKKWEKVLNC